MLLSYEILILFSFSSYLVHILSYSFQSNINRRFFTKMNRFVSRNRNLLTVHNFRIVTKKYKLNNYRYYSTVNSDNLSSQQIDVNALPESKRLLLELSTKISSNLSKDVVDYNNLKEKVKYMELESSQPEFWNDQTKAQVIQDYRKLHLL